MSAQRLPEILWAVVGDEEGLGIIFFIGVECGDNGELGKGLLLFEFAEGLDGSEIDLGQFPLRFIIDAE